MRRIRFLLPAAAAGLLVPAVAAGAVWEISQVPLSPSDENASLGVNSRNVVVDASDRVHLLYQKNLSGDVYQVFYTVRETDGTWSEAQLVSEPQANARNAVIVIDRDGRLHGFWQRSEGGNEDIATRVRETDGTWGDPMLVAPAAGQSRFPVAAVDAFNRVHVVWMDGRSGKQEILHTAKDAAASQWDPVQVLSTGGVSPSEPTMDADDLGAVHIAWSDRGSVPLPRISYDILYLRLVAGGGIAPVRLVAKGAISVTPFIEALADGTVHLVWVDNRDGGLENFSEIYYKRYLPGIGWGNDKRFSYDEADHRRPIIVSGPDQTLNLAWEDYRNQSPDIYYRQITDEFGWDPESTPLTTDVSSSVAPCLAALSNGRLVLIWSDAQGTGSFRIQVKEGTVR